LPITLADSVPEPDIAVIRGPLDQYNERHPAAGDVGLVIEVADTSVEEDQGWKQQIYARARIPTYWIVNLVDEQVEVHTRPVAGRSPRYRDREVFARGTSVSATLGSEQLGPLAVSDLLPPTLPS
jgi:Uma2 family endonuclease